MTITADQIAEYLQDHLDFFEQHPELARELKLPQNPAMQSLWLNFNFGNYAIMSASSKKKMII